MPGDVKFDTRLAPLACPPDGAFRPANLTSIPRKRRFFGPFLGFDLGSFASKTSSFLAPKNANSCLFNKSLGSFPLFSIFFHLPRLFPLAGSLWRCLAASACPRALATTRIGYHESDRLSSARCKLYSGPRVDLGERVTGGSAEVSASRRIPLRLFVPCAKRPLSGAISGGRAAEEGKMRPHLRPALTGGTRRKLPRRAWTYPPIDCGKGCYRHLLVNANCLLARDALPAGRRSL